MLASWFLATIVCVSVLSFTTAQRNRLSSPEMGLFQWCKKIECVKGKHYYNTNNYYKIEDIPHVNKSAASWEIPLGLWSEDKAYILLAERAKGLAWSGNFYLVGFKVPIPNVESTIYSKNKEEEEAHHTIFNFTEEKPWLPMRTEFKPFVLKVTPKGPKAASANWTGGISQNVTLEAPDGRIIIYRLYDRGPPIDIQYIAFGSAANFASKFYFGCPRNFPVRVAVPALGRINMPKCGPDLCEHCPGVYLPVCASTQRTYRNECLFRCQVDDPSVKVLYKGTCMHWLWQF